MFTVTEYDENIFINKKNMKKRFQFLSLFVPYFLFPQPVQNPRTIAVVVKMVKLQCSLGGLYHPSENFVSTSLQYLLVKFVSYL